MGGAWVFPGGAVHDDDDGPAAAAVRELEEEAGHLAPGLRPSSSRSRAGSRPKGSRSASTPGSSRPGAGRARRPRSTAASASTRRWLRPADALAAGARDELMLVFPTIKHLELLAETATVEETLAAARARPVTPVLPKVIPERCAPAGAAARRARLRRGVTAQPDAAAGAATGPARLCSREVMKRTLASLATARRPSLGGPCGGRRMRRHADRHGGRRPAGRERRAPTSSTARAERTSSPAAASNDYLEGGPGDDQIDAGGGLDLFDRGHRGGPGGRGRRRRRGIRRRGRGPRGGRPGRRHDLRPGG